MAVIKYRNYTLGAFVPEAQPRDTNDTVGIIPIWYFNKENILNARSEAEGILPKKMHHLILQYTRKVSNIWLGPSIPLANRNIMVVSSYLNARKLRYGQLR